LSPQSAHWSHAISKKIVEGVPFNAHLFDTSNSENYEKGGVAGATPLLMKQSLL